MRLACCKGLLLAAIPTVLFLAGCGGQPETTGSVPPVEAPFTLVMLPDTQHYSEANPEYFYAQTHWIADHVQDQNIVFVTHVGDIVEHGDREGYEWDVADLAMSWLDDVVPWGTAVGNHDYDLGLPLGRGASYLQFFGPDRFEGQEWFGGASENGLNNYQLFEGSGRNFLIFHLEANTPDYALDWAQSVLRENPGLAAIVTTHIYQDDLTGYRTQEADYRTDVGNSGEQIWDKFVRKNPQVFLVLSGHWWPAGGEARQISTNDAGQPVIEILADYQMRDNGGDGWLRLLHFEPAEKRIRVETYSPSLDQYETDQDSQFEIPLDFETRFP